MSLDDIIPNLEAQKKQAEKIITLIFKVPQEKVPDLTVEYSLEALPKTIGDLKTEISQKHLFKPTVERQKLLFRGRLLQND